LGVGIYYSTGHGSDADTQQANEQADFWIGMILSMGETQNRRFKTRTSKRSNGITAGLALMTRGWIINNIDGSALAKNHKWFGNNKSEESLKRNATTCLVDDFCKNTWTYGLAMAKIIKDLFADLGTIALLAGDELTT
jgi:hypothetical protein